MPKKIESLTTDEYLDKLIKDGLKIGLDVPEQKWYTTGNMAIDCATGGGIPIGRIATFAGAHASGKTTTAVSAAKDVIEQFNRRVLFIDYERTFDAKYFKNLGVDVDDNRVFVRYLPKTLEEGFNTARNLVTRGEFGLVIFDSIAKMQTEKQLTADISSGMDLEKSKLLRAALNQANDYAYDNDCTIVLLNHLMEKIDISWAGQQKANKGIKEFYMPGGTGPGYFSSLILYFEKWGAITSEEFDPIKNEEIKQKIGWRHTVTVAKNKVAKPDMSTDVINILGEGFSNARTAYAILQAYGVVTKDASWYTIKDDTLAGLVDAKQVQGEENTYQVIFEGDREARGTAIGMAREFLQQTYDELESQPDKDTQ